MITKPIPDACIKFVFSRSSGPGGQNVNKVNTQATAIVDIQACDFLTAEQKEMIFTKLANRIDKTGNLQITGNRYRSQQANREDVVERLNRLIAWALIKPRIRKATKATLASKRRRLDQKKKRSQVKQGRTGKFLNRDSDY